ncbi:MAG: glycosyltransferase [Bacteroidetes bacterium]|nr:glycosyltransferase [Bacteroidota bacterium]
MPNILFIASHRPGRSPSQRFRFEQYLKWLTENGYTYHFSYTISENDDKSFYQKGKLFKKIIIILKTILIRIKDWFSYNQYDIVFVQREALLIGSTFFERKIKKSKAKLIFDFDDSIWLMNVSDGNKKFKWLKNPEKTSKIIETSDLIFAGNQYLADYSKTFNKNVIIIPTTIDTSVYVPFKAQKADNIITIGWSGSITTIQHFEFALDFLKEIKKKYGAKINITVVGDKNYVNDELDIKGLPWVSEKEIEVLNTFDIGIMPLPDDLWAKGKCGLKGLQYMSLEIPTIMSPVGVNTEIIKHGENGFLATTIEEWVKYISYLIDNPEERIKIGKSARKIVVEKYSMEANKQKYLDAFNSLIKP